MPRSEVPASRAARERRAAGSRLLVELPVTVMSDGFRHPCKTVNISTSGMVVELNGSLSDREPHLVYTYELELPDRRRLRVSGRTAWRQGALQGVRFAGLLAEHREVIADVMHEIRKQRASDLDRLELAEHLDRLRAIGRNKTAA